MSKDIVPIEHIENKILTIRGRRVILDADLAQIYGVPTKRLNEQVKRNAERFPPDFVFRLEPEEVQNLKSQIATSSGNTCVIRAETGSAHGGRRKLPLAFTEHGAIMAANVLNSPRVLIPPFIKRGKKGDFHSAIRTPHSAIIFALCFLLHIFCD